MRILVAYRGLPWPITEGYHLRILHLFRRLAARHEIHLLGLIQGPEPTVDRAALEAEGIFASVTTVAVPRRRWRGRAATNLGIRPVQSFHAECPGFSAELRRTVEQRVHERDIDVAYVFDPWGALWFEPCQVVPTLLDVCDSRSLYYRRFAAEVGPSWWARLRNRQLLRRFEAYERHLLSRYPMATVVSPADGQHLRGLVPDARVEVVANGVDLEQFALEGLPAEEPERLIFFGNMDFWPNVDAAQRTAREILPRLRGLHPEATLTLAGSNPAPEVRELAELPGVQVTGTVPDLRPFIACAALLVAPLRFGAGLKNKILEAMALEKPVVTTPRGAEALSPEVTELLLVAADDEGIVRHLDGLLRDASRRRELGARGRAAVGRSHSWEAAARRYEGLFEELAASPAGAPES